MGPGPLGLSATLLGLGFVDDSDASGHTSMGEQTGALTPRAMGSLPSFTRSPSGQQARTARMSAAQAAFVRMV